MKKKETLDGIRFNELTIINCYPAHDGKKQLLLQQQHRYRAAATAAAALSIYKCMPGI